MTRVNVVAPYTLADQHLMAEFRELKHIVPAMRRSRNSKGGITGIVPNYTMQTGHVKFFYHRLDYVTQRYSDVGNELLLRGFNVDYTSASNVILDQLFNGEWLPPAKWHESMWVPNVSDVRVNISRITERLLEREKGFYRHYSNYVDVHWLIELMHNTTYTPKY